jgi:branched-subunit amino acid permease
MLGLFERCQQKRIQNMIFIYIYLIVAVLIYIVPPIFGIDFDGKELPPALLVSIAWLIIFPILMVAYIAMYSEKWRKKIIERRRAKL